MEKLKKLKIIILLFISALSYSQNFVPFTPRFDRDINGDILIIGNNILNRNVSPDTPNIPYNGTSQNGYLDMQYIDIDDDPNTFSSSSADLNIPISSSCPKIAYAALYWGALLQSGDRTNIDKVKFKTPSGNYIDLTGQIIYDANVTPIGTTSSKPYICFTEVTSILSSLSNPNGTYTLANLLSSTGSNAGMGLSAGWTLFIVYEDPILPRKAITSFHGFTGIANSGAWIDIPMSGIRTIPTGPVRTKFGFSALEGDYGISGDYLKINGTSISGFNRPANNFFNSSITTPTGSFIARNPNGSNTLGIDAGIFDSINPANTVIPNNATSATVKIGDQGDTYFYYFNVFANEIIEPKINLSCSIQDLTGIDITNQNVSLCQDMICKINFQNIGNDDATNLAITHHISGSVYFDPLTDLTMPSGVTWSYDPTLRNITFYVPNNLVNIGDPLQSISIKQKVECSCNNFKTACSNLISNQSFANYSGLINQNFITYQSSNSNSDICNPISSPSKVTVNINNCNYQSSIKLCDLNGVNLSAPNGYDNYEWSGPLPSTSIIGNTQFIVVNQTGIYNVKSISNSCQSITEEITVTPCTPSNIVIQNGNRLSAEENNATYQWIDCNNGNTPITGETNQYFDPQTSGLYAVIVTNSLGYSVTSSCVNFTYLQTNDFNSVKFTVYPNPANDTLKINLNDQIDKITLINLLGQKNEIFTNGNNEFKINNLSPGNYIIQFELGDQKYFSKMIKE